MGQTHIHQHPPQSELPTQRSSRQENKESTHRDNTPLHPQLATCYVEAGAKLRENRGGETLGEDVGKLGGGQDMEDPNIADSNLAANEVQVDLHILCPLMLNGVSGEIHSADVVAVDERALGVRAMELRQELAKPGRLRHTVSDSTVLRLGTGAQETRLAPRKTA